MDCGDGPVYSGYEPSAGLVYSGYDVEPGGVGGCGSYGCADKLWDA